MTLNFLRYLSSCEYQDLLSRAHVRYKFKRLHNKQEEYAHSIEHTHKSMHVRTGHSFMHPHTLHIIIST